MSLKRVWLTDREGAEHEAVVPYPGADRVVVPAACACGSFYVQGGAQQVDGHDVYRAQAYCASCRSPRGVLRAQVSTLFGVEEDERMMDGPWKVY